MAIKKERKEGEEKRRGRTHRDGDGVPPSIGLAIRGTLEVAEPTIREVIPALGIVQFALARLALRRRTGHQQTIRRGVCGVLRGDHQVGIFWK